MSDTQILQAIDALNLEGIRVLTDLQLCLEQELAALTSRDIDAIKSVNEQKQPLLEQFANNGTQRAKQLASAELSNDQQGIQQLLERCATSAQLPTFQQNWQQLNQQLTQVMASNQRNEQVLLRNQRNLEKVLSILQGHRPANMLYGSSGGKSDYTGQSRIGKA